MEIRELSGGSVSLHIATYIHRECSVDLAGDTFDSEKSWRSKVGSALQLAWIMIVLLVTAAVYGRLGSRDLSEALTFNGKITGALLPVGAFVVTLGACAAVIRWVKKNTSVASLIAFVSSCTAFTVNMILPTQGSSS
jgi:VIT1/CCC1 family predicted Fe2+/Mn2+ transporter